MNPVDLMDELGPEKIIYLHNPDAGLKAIVVVDNTACGAAIGGSRMAEDVSLQECARLARAMTLKNVSAGLPHGGGKSVIFADPAIPEDDKENLMRAFAQAIACIDDYIVGPDMGTNERCMAYINDEIGRSVGLPREIGGIPLDEIGATGLGVCAAALAAEQYSGVKVKGARMAVQGFGAVGIHAARYLEQHGAILVAASDSLATVSNQDGLDVQTLIQHKQDGGKLTGFKGAVSGDRDTIIGIDCDIWIPAARPDIVTMENVEQLSTRLVVQGANIPVSQAAEHYLHEKGVVSIPDYIANAGGVICAAVELRRGSESEAVTTIERKIRANTEEVLGLCQKLGQTPREAADDLALERLAAARSIRRWHGHKKPDSLCRLSQAINR